MTKKVEIEELKKEENKKRKLLADSEWSSTTMMMASTPRDTTTELRSVEINENESYSDLPGRRSFGGFNPNVERIYGSHLDDSQNKVAREKEIVANFDKLVSLPRGPSQVILPMATSRSYLFCEKGVMQPMGGDRKKNKQKGNNKR